MSKEGGNKKGKSGKRALRIIIAVLFVVVGVGALLGGIAIGNSMEEPLFGSGQEQQEQQEQSGEITAE